jgi:hydroxymethylglutaryl-CoA lyase
MSDFVTLYEMGPRDGLQNEPDLIATQDKITLVDRLSDSGLKHIEVTSFVSPKWVPQMADAAQVLAAISRKPGVVYAALTPNIRGFENALAAGADEVAIFASASEGFSHANINCSIAQSIERFAPIMDAARDAGVRVRGYVSCVTDCPYDGSVTPSAVANVAAKLMALGCYQVSLGDTIGAATPKKTTEMLTAVLTQVAAQNLAGHFHDTRGHAIDNIAVSLDMGLRDFDAAVGGLGGCPYAPGAQGNVATERVVEFLHAQGVETGIDREKLNAAAVFAKELRK